MLFLFWGVVWPPQQTQAKLRSMMTAVITCNNVSVAPAKNWCNNPSMLILCMTSLSAIWVCRGFSYAFNFQLHARPLGVPLNTSQTFSNSHLAPCIGGFRRPRRFRNSSAQAFDCGPAHALHLSCKHSCAVRGGRCLSNACYLIAWI